VKDRAFIKILIVLTICINVLTVLILILMGLAKIMSLIIKCKQLHSTCSDIIRSILTKVGHFCVNNRIS
jgi:hypothetical protein